jgi:hypothetical protein
VGKVDIRKLENFAQDDTDAYSYSGGLCLANQGLLEFVEMFKAPIKVLHPLLTATQEGNYKGTEGFGAIPFDGMVLAHSNESEWKAFRNNRNNEAFLDRIYIVKVPYCLRVSEEVKIYEKLIRESSLANAMRARHAQDDGAVRRAHAPEGAENSSIFSKMQVYDGESLKDTDPRAKSYQEYRDYAGVDEGMSGISTRFAFKILSKVFNYDSTEVAANPVHLMYVLEQQIEREQFPAELETKYTGFIKEYLSPRYAEFIGKEIQTAYLESYSEYGQNIFDRYVTYADYWIQDSEYRDTDTGEVFDRNALNAELEKIESPPASPTPRTSATRSSTSCCARANNQGKNPSWTSYEKLRVVIEKKMFSNTEELLPVISFNAKASAEEAKKHEDFVTRMEAKGYTPKQVRLLCEWYLRVRKSSSLRGARAPAPGMACPGMRDGIAYHRPQARRQEQVGGQPRALRAPLQAQIAEAVRRAVASATSATSSRREHHHPRKDISEPVFHHGQGGVRDTVHPGNGACARRPHRAAAGRRGARRQASDSGEGEDDFTFTLTKEEFMALLRRPGAAAPAAHPHRRDRNTRRRAGYSHDGTPTTWRWCAPCAAPWAGALRWASRQPRAAGAGSSWTICWRRTTAPARRRPSCSSIEALRARMGSAFRPDRPALSQPHACRAQQPGRDVLPDGRVRLDGRAAQGPGQALLHPAVPVSHAALREDRDGLHPPPHPGGEVERDFLPLHRKRRHGGQQRAGAARQIIRARYPAQDWNIYVAQASDGDNFGDDSANCKLLADKILPLVRYYAYVQVAPRSRTCGRSTASCRRCSLVRHAQGGRGRRDLPGVPRLFKKEGLLHDPLDVPRAGAAQRPPPQAGRRRRARRARRAARRCPPASAPPAARPQRLELRADRALRRHRRHRRALRPGHLPEPAGGHQRRADDGRLRQLGMPVGYRHWLYGKAFLAVERHYRRGRWAWPTRS